MMKISIFILFAFGLFGVTYVVAADSNENEPLRLRYFGHDFKSGAYVEKEKTKKAKPIARIDYLELPDCVPSEIKHLIDVTNKVIEHVNERKLQSMSDWFEEKILSDSPQFNGGLKFISFTPTLSVTRHPKKTNWLLIEIDGAGKFLEEDEEGQRVVKTTNSRFHFTNERFRILSITTVEGKVVSIYPGYGDKIHAAMMWEKDRILYRASEVRRMTEDKRTPNPFPWITWDINGKLLENTTKSLWFDPISAMGMGCNSGISTKRWYYDGNGKRIED